MKTIEVTDEQFEALKKIAELLKTQNNRCTENPIFCIYEKREVTKPEGCGDEKGWIIDGDLLNEEDALQAVSDWRMDNPDREKDKLTDYEVLTDELEGTEIEFSIEDVRVDQGQYYFTEESAQRHIDLNHYHYHQPFTYVESAWRNPEWELIQAVLTQSKTFRGPVHEFKIGDRVQNKCRSKGKIFIVKHVGEFKYNCTEEGGTWCESDFKENWEPIGDANVL
jgi:hypothetical protein